MPDDAAVFHGARDQEGIPRVADDAAIRRAFGHRQQGFRCLGFAIEDRQVGRPRGGEPIDRGEAIARRRVQLAQGFVDLQALQEVAEAVGDEGVGHCGLAR